MKKSCVCLTQITTLYLGLFQILVAFESAGSSPISTNKWVNPRSEKKLYGVTVHLSDEGEMLRVRAESLQDSEIMLCTISGMGVPCEIVYKSLTEAIIWPVYPLLSGEYIVKVRGNSDEKRFKIAIKKVEKMF